jgi:hypothetical protein
MLIPSGKRITEGADVFQSISRSPWTNLHQDGGRKRIRPRTKRVGHHPSMCGSMRQGNPKVSKPFFSD